MGQLTDTKLKALKPRAKPYEVADGDGLFAEVLVSGSVVWRYRYRLHGKREKVTIGPYPALSLADARQKHRDLQKVVANGRSPMREKQESKIAATIPSTVEEFSKVWVEDVVKTKRKDTHQIERYFERDINPAFGKKRLSDVTQADVFALTDRIKGRGSEQSALLLRNILKRMFAYAIARQMITFNPAAAIPTELIATPKSRDRVLSADEAGRFLRTVYRSSMRTSNKLALHLLMITMVRKSELLLARWENVDLDKGQWHIPPDETKVGKPHVVYLSRQATEIFEELKAISSGSAFVFPCRSSLDKPVCRSVLNNAVKALDLDIPSFVIHDFRRTASTHLHEMGFASDVVERALGHTIGGVRGIYNRADYSSQHREMLQQWADTVDAWRNGVKVIPIKAA